MSNRDTCFKNFPSLNAFFSSISFLHEKLHYTIYQVIKIIYLTRILYSSGVTQKRIQRCIPVVVRLYLFIPRRFYYEIENTIYFILRTIIFSLNIISLVCTFFISVCAYEWWSGVDPMVTQSIEIFLFNCNKYYNIPT